jgi:hypothetical protein
VIPLSQQDRLLSPIEIRVADDGEGLDGMTPAKYWMRARNIPKFEASFQKVVHSAKFSGDSRTQFNVQCILAYLSDLTLCASVLSAVEFRINMSTIA